MRRHVATFEIDSQTDSDAVRRLLDRVYDTIREESQHRDGTDDANRVLDEFRALRDAAAHSASGTLTITYEED
ncbi:hypothetical protein [Halogranum rubrum]|uniref:Uncharacterized protein n=1 Tax=Halogranum salarium B-1 TaxID=1210908 RepID=J2ZJQ1_9EURY|nr:hypothetical protein [Halogranum salarium]EJN60950.1 hypothetical protein HSB1_15530 [Halogranum salarium B-1]